MFVVSVSAKIWIATGLSESRQTWPKTSVFPFLKFTYHSVTSRGHTFRWLNTAYITSLNNSTVTVLDSRLFCYRLLWLTPSLGEDVTVQQAALHRATLRESYWSSWYLCPTTVPSKRITTAVFAIAGREPEPVTARPGDSPLVSQVASLLECNPRHCWSEPACPTFKSCSFLVTFQTGEAGHSGGGVKQVLNCHCLPLLNAALAGGMVTLLPLCGRRWY